MTSAELILARDGDAGASAGSVALWRSIVGFGSIGDADYQKRHVSPEAAGAALDQIAWYLGAGTDVPNHTLQEAIFRAGSYLVRSRTMLGFHGSLGEGMPDADPARGGYGVLRRSGAMPLLELSKVRRAGLI